VPSREDVADVVAAHIERVHERFASKLTRMRGTAKVVPQLAGLSGILQVDGCATYEMRLPGTMAVQSSSPSVSRMARCQFVKVYKSTKSPFAIKAENRGRSASQR
jgi:hypothetical protein